MKKPACLIFLVVTILSLLGITGRLFKPYNPNAIRECIKQICNAGQLSDDFALKPAEVQTAFALITRSGERVIYYNKDYFDTISNRTEEVAILAHEIGHFANKDFAHKDRTIADELEADRYAGTILYLLKLDIKQAMQLLDEDCPLMVNGYHPARSDRKQALEDGFNSGKSTAYHNITFDYGTSNLTVDGYQALEPTISDLKKYPGKIVVYGYYISDKGATQDLKISVRQALAVKTYLVARGIPSDSITTKGFGETHPIAPNTTPLGRLMNCRIEFRK